MAKAIYWYEHRDKRKSENDFEKVFFWLIKNSVFGQTMENFWKHRDIKLATTEKR